MHRFNEEINSFTYKGINSKDMGMFVMNKQNVYGGSSPLIETVNIPARGNLIIDNKADILDNERFEDYDITYTCCIDTDGETELFDMARRIYKWLYTDISYERLYDTYELDCYKEAYIKGSVSVSELAGKILGNFNVVFTVRAYKKTLRGTKPLVINKKDTEIFNPEGFTALPYIKIYGTGDIILYINNRSHSFKGIDTYIEIDSELMNAYKGQQLQNNKMLTTTFPKLAAGKNNISWLGNVQKVEIIPRWCRL